MVSTALLAFSFVESKEVMASPSMFVTLLRATYDMPVVNTFGLISMTACERVIPWTLCTVVAQHGVRGNCVGEQCNFTLNCLL